jgi:hypothetical protein
MELLEYEVVINGMPTTAQLTAQQAQRLGGTPVASPRDMAAEHAKRAKGRKPANKSANQD